MGHEVPSTEGISSSGAFSDTSIGLLKRKIGLVGLDNIILVDGPFNGASGFPMGRLNG